MMAKRKRALAAVRMLLRSLEDLVDGNRWNLDANRLSEWRLRSWAGADIVVCAVVSQPSCVDPCPRAVGRCTL
ncbi:MAG: hypothetical protein WCJ31_05605 [Planctomycetia bacterium]